MFGVDVHVTVLKCFKMLVAFSQKTHFSYSPEQAPRPVKASISRGIDTSFYREALALENTVV